MGSIWRVQAPNVRAGGEQTGRGDHSAYQDGHLNIIRLRAGEQASYSADRIHVWRVSPGKYRWTGALATEGDAAFASGTGCESQGEAEADGIAWAQSYVVRVLMIQLGAQ
jgi:hypothetical protein